MEVAFYAPLKGPDHPVPSGDRLMARMLVAALIQQGHRVHLMSDLRSFCARPDPTVYGTLKDRAQREIERIAQLWDSGKTPDLWLTYHPYYKAPDLLGPVLAPAHAMPYVTVETSYSERRNIGAWAEMQDRVLDGIRMAAINICLTNRDRDGIAMAAPNAGVAMLRPFIDPLPYLRALPRPAAPNFAMITVAMMRPGDKMDSYLLLAKALSLLPPDLPWHLTIVGDGVLRAEVTAQFAQFGTKVRLQGQATTAQIAELMKASALFVWPGYGEAYGLAFLEAQAAGLPVVALSIAGVPEAVQHARTGLLTPPDDAHAFARAIERLLTNHDERLAMGSAARQFILSERTFDRAAQHLDAILGGLKSVTS